MPKKVVEVYFDLIDHVWRARLKEDKNIWRVGDTKEKAIQELLGHDVLKGESKDIHDYEVVTLR